MLERSQLGLDVVARPKRICGKRKLFLLLPWSQTCRKRGNSAQNEIGPKSGFPVLTRPQSAFRPLYSGVW